MTVVVALLTIATGLSAAHGAVDTGVIRLAEPTSPPDAESALRQDLDPLADARRGFDVRAFDSRLESLWFQRKAYQTQGREQDADHQAELIRDFVAEEGVRRLEVPAGALVLEARAWMREGNYDKALAALALAESIDPGRPQIAVARAHVLWASKAGIVASGTELLRAIRGTATHAVRDLSVLHRSAVVAVAAFALAIGLFSFFMVLRHQVALRHDVEEWFVAGGGETWAKAGGWAVLLFPFVIWIGAGWAAMWGIVATFRYMRRGERVLAMTLLAAATLLVPAYRFGVGLFGLAADPTVRTTIAAANGGYDPDRIVKLRELVDAHPDDPMYRFLLAGLYKNGRYFEEAFEEYKRVLQASPSTYQARINLGNIYFLLGQYGEAISNYRKALEIRPDAALAYYDMYLAQSDSFKLKEAAESLSRAKELDPARTNRLLTLGSRDGGGPKVVDAVIDFESIWRATLEGRHLRDWLDGAPSERGWSSAFRGAGNPLTVLAALSLLACGFLALAFRGRAPATRCVRCGRPFCTMCRSGRDGHEYCTQCVHLFVLGDGLAPETKSSKLYEVERHEAWQRRGRRLAAVIVPGASHLLSGRAWIGCTLVTLWLLALIGGFPQVLAPFERLFGTGFQAAALRPGPLPNAFGFDATVLLAVPLALVVWIAGNLGLRGARRA